MYLLKKKKYIAYKAGLYERLNAQTVGRHEELVAPRRPIGEDMGLVQIWLAVGGGV